MDNNNIQELIKNRSTQLLSQIIEYRRHIHQYPELSFNELETAKYINKVLEQHNIEVDNSFGENAVVGIIMGKNKENTIALRADIDALPIVEENESIYTSKNRGIMHACGHDAHIASLLGTAIILKEFSKYINGNIILIFQPAEERNPGGAKILIEKGILKKYNIRKVLAQHVTPEVETGHFCFGSGNLMASTDELYISFNGVGGHAALPAKRSDTVLAMVEFINKAVEMQNQLVEKSPVIIAFGKLTADGAVNIVPSQTSAEGTMRTFAEDIRKHIKIELRKIAEKIAKIHRCTVDFEIRDGYPSLFNDIELSQEVYDIAKEYLPMKSIEKFNPRMTSEDFAYFSKEIPAVLYRTGIEGNGFGKIGLHNPKFDIDENVFSISSGFMAYLALRLISEK